MDKSPDAFRTISEVADWLGIQAHVLRFWESKFTQVRPVKRAGGRRYYRPGDMLLLGGIKQLLHEDGLTIKGVQKVLREEGMSHVAALSMPLDELTQSQLEDAPEAAFVEAVEEPPEEKGVVLNFDTAPAKPEPEPEVVAPDPAPEQPAAPVDEVAAPDLPVAAAPPAPETSVTAAKVEETAEPVAKPEPPVAAPAPAAPPTPEKTPEPVAAAPVDPIEPEPLPVTEQVSAKATTDGAELPAFLRRQLPPKDAPADPPQEAAPTPEASTPPVEAAPEPTPPAPEPAPPKPRIIDMPPLTQEHLIDAAPGALSAVYRARRLSAEQARQITPLRDKLTALRDRMAASAKGGRTPGPNA